MITQMSAVCSMVALSFILQGSPSDQVPTLIHGFEGKAAANLVLPGSTTTGLASYALADKTVQIIWQWETSGPRPIQHSTQKESLTFFPTEVCQVGPGRMAVAGKRRSKTIIELWQFGTPVIPPVPGTANQQYVYPELSVPIVSKTVLYEEATVGRDIVSCMLNNPVPPASATASIFVQFFDSKDLYALNYSQGSSVGADAVAFSCVRKAQADPANPTIPVLSELNTHFASRWSAKHATYGYVYIFVHPNVPALVLYDANLDGALDSPGYLLLDDAAWMAGDWGDLTTYLAYY